MMMIQLLRCDLPTRSLRGGLCAQLLRFKSNWNFFQINRSVLVLFCQDQVHALRLMMMIQLLRCDLPTRSLRGGLRAQLPRFKSNWNFFQIDRNVLVLFCQDQVHALRPAPLHLMLLILQTIRADHIAHHQVESHLCPILIVPRHLQAPVNR